MLLFAIFILLKTIADFASLPSFPSLPSSITPLLRYSHFSISFLFFFCRFLCTHQSTDLTFDRTTASVGYEILIDVASDDVISSATSIAGFDCNIQFTLNSKDDYFKNSVSQSMALDVTGAGCGVGEWLGDFPTEEMDTLVSNEHGRNVSQCVCSMGYFRDMTGWCSPCIQGGLCENINTKLITMKSQTKYWRNHSESENFTQCEGSSEHTTCVSGWQHNHSQCRVGHAGVLCGTCDPKVVTYQVLSGAAYYGGLNSTNGSILSSVDIEAYLAEQNQTEEGKGGVNTSAYVLTHPIKTFQKYWKKRDRSSYVVSQPDLCIKCVIEVSVANDGSTMALKPADIQTIIATVLIVLGFIFCVFYILWKPLKRRDAMGAKVVPINSGSVSALRRRPSLLLSPSETDTRFLLTRQRTWILVEHLQVLSHLGVTYAVNWPTEFRNFFQMFFFVNFDLWSSITGYDVCLLVSDSFYAAMETHLITPLIILALLVLAFLVVVLVGMLRQMEIGPVDCCCGRSCCVRRFNYYDTGAAWRRMVGFFHGILRLMVPGAVSRAIRVWQCIKVDGRLWMVADLREECHVSERWKSASIFSMILVILYLAVVPLVQTYMLHRRAGQEESAWDSVNSMEAYGDLYLHLRVPYMYSWWESVSLIQRSLLTGVLMLMMPGTSVQLMFACLLCLIWLFISLQLRPYKDAWSRNLHVCSQFVLTTTFLMGLCVRADQVRFFL